MSSEPTQRRHDPKEPRIPMADTGRLSDAQRAVYEKILEGRRGRVVGPLRVALHSPALADGWQVLGEFLRFRTGLPPRASELAIIATGRYWNCQLEWLIHSEAATEAGLAPDIVEAIRTGRQPEFDEPLQRAVYEFARELLQHGQVSDDVYRALLELVDVSTLVELTAIVGYYSMVAMTLNAHRVPLPDDERGSLLDLPQGRHMPEPTRLPESVQKGKAGRGAGI